MGILFSRFFAVCGLFEIAVAVAMHLGVRLHPRLKVVVDRLGSRQKHSAFAQLCLGAACMLFALLFSTREANEITWVAVGLGPVLFTLGLWLERQARRAAESVAAAQRYRHKRDSIQPSGGAA